VTHHDDVARTRDGLDLAPGGTHAREKVPGALAIRPVEMRLASAQASGPVRPMALQLGEREALSVAEVTSCRRSSTVSGARSVAAMASAVARARRAGLV
jgi:hypothetical protein